MSNLDNNITIYADQYALLFEDNETEIRQIQKDMADLQELFQDMSYIVEYQQPLIDRIEDNITNTSLHTEAGLQDVVRTETKQNKKRSRTCCLLLLVIILLLLIIILIIIVEN